MSTEEKKQVIQLRTFSPEVAQEHLQKVLDFYGIESDDNRGVVIDGVDQGEEVKGSYKRIVRAIAKGIVEVVEEDDGGITLRQHLLRSPAIQGPLKWREIDGSMGMVASKAEISFDDMHGQVLAFAAGMTGLKLSDVYKIKGQDILILKALGLLFFAA